MGATTESTDTPIVTEKDPATARKGLRFWAIIVALAFTGLLTSMEATVVSTAMPTIVASLGGGANYIWAANGYFLAMTSLQPMFGQLANVFGRRWPLILSTVAFTLGSGLCGGANNMAMLIAGRVVQGVGAAGINVLIETVVCDLLPLRERGAYMGAMFGMISFGTALGPLFGGLIVQYSTWRWVFYMAVPVGVVALVLLFVFLKVKYDRSTNLATSLTSIDWLGNAVFVAAVSAILIALGWAGVVYAWSSYQVLVPLIIGTFGIVGFVILEGSSLIPNPTMPLHLFSNRTSAIGFIFTFFHGLIGMWALYFLPVYFQGSLAADANQAGIMLLPTVLVLIPAAITGGVVLTKFGRYRPLQFAGSALMVIGFGLFTMLDEHSSTGAWVGYQIIEAAGMGLVIPVLLPSILAGLTDDDTALATGTWSFMRSFGMTWGTAIPAVIFDNRAAILASRGSITDEKVAAEIMEGHAYQQATALYLTALPSETQLQVRAIVTESLRLVWQVAIPFAAVAFLLLFFVREITLRKEVGGDFGMVEIAEEKDKA